MNDPIDASETWSGQSDAARRRLSPTALKAVLRIGEKWKLTQESTLALIGLFDLPSAADVRLTADEFYRAGLLIEIFKATSELFGSRLADSWPLLPNRNSVFGGASPIELIVNGDSRVMADVLQYLRISPEGF